MNDMGLSAQENRAGSSRMSLTLGRWAGFWLLEGGRLHKITKELGPCFLECRPAVAVIQALSC